MPFFMMTENTPRRCVLSPIDSVSAIREMALAENTPIFGDCAAGSNSVVDLLLGVVSGLFCVACDARCAAESGRSFPRLLGAERPEVSVKIERANLTRLVLGCIEAEFCEH